LNAAQKHIGIGDGRGAAAAIAGGTRIGGGRSRPDTKPRATEILFTAFAMLPTAIRKLPAAISSAPAVPTLALTRAANSANLRRAAPASSGRFAWGPKTAGKNRG